MTDDDLKKKWSALAGKYALEFDLKELLWKEIQTHYSAPGRYYHTLDHIANLLALFEEYQALLSAPEAVQFAIWYHDIIYVPGRGDNETKSAELAEKRLTESGVPEPVTLTCLQLIEATKTHRLPPEADNFDGRFFLDADLSILGADWESYLEYTQQVRKEFEHLPAMIYSLGRSGVIKSFLNRERIYLTDELHLRFEKQARENITRELELLGA